MRPLDHDTKAATKKISPSELRISVADLKDTADDSKVFENVQKAAKQAEFEQIIMAEREKARKAAARAAMNGPGGRPGGSNGPGARGSTGGDEGPGIGRRSGPGSGDGGDINGRPATSQEIHANRWRIYLPPDIEQHRRTLVAMNVTYIFKHPAGGYFQVLDLRRTPAEVIPAPPIDSRNVVTWNYTDTQVLRGLAQRLRIPFSPVMGVMMLPSDVEQKLASVEREAMEKAGRRPETVHMTVFDVRFVKDTYEPYVRGFE
jgi:hypothetical protein